MSHTGSPQTPKSKPIIKTTPKALSTPESSSKGLNILLQNAAANVNSASALSAVFLVQFDVKSGYVLKWSKTVSKDISLKGVEYKCLPSGLHEVERDVISFVQFQDKENDSETQPFDNLFYGVSVFHQNLNEAVGNSRSKVKMFSLGILVDPLGQIQSKSSASKFSKFSGDLPAWKPMYYTTGLEYVDELHRLLDQWDNSGEDYGAFEEFFDKHSSKPDLLDLIGSKSPRSPRTSIPKLEIQPLHGTLNGKHHSHHFLLHITTLLNSLGPLVFKVWRSALLRERILLFDAPSVELNCAFAYCLAILSTIPQEIHWLLNESGSWATSVLQFIQPVYSIGVNDIDWLKSLLDQPVKGNQKASFIASTTDEILLFKSTLYDISVQFNQPHHVSTTIPKVLLSDAAIPGSQNTTPLRATQRDLKRFKIIAREFNLNGKLAGDTENESATNIGAKLHDNAAAPPSTATTTSSAAPKIEKECNILPWWNEVSEPPSWRQLAWSGFYWWASAGEKERIEEEQEIEGLNEMCDCDKNETEQALILVGYFQNMTKRIFTTIADIINNVNEEESKDGDSNVDEDELNKTIWIEPADIFQMGLDPYSEQDSEFVVKLVELWWNRKAQVGSKLSNLCCF